MRTICQYHTLNVSICVYRNSYTLWVNYNHYYDINIPLLRFRFNFWPKSRNAVFSSCKIWNHITCFPMLIQLRFCAKLFWHAFNSNNFPRNFTKIPEQEVKQTEWEMVMDTSPAAVRYMAFSKVNYQLIPFFSSRLNNIVSWHSKFNPISSCTNSMKRSGVEVWAQWTTMNFSSTIKFPKWLIDVIISCRKCFFSSLGYLKNSLKCG